MTTTEAAKALGLSRNTVQVQIASGKLRATKIGRDWHITEADIRRYVATYKRGSKA